MRPEWDCYSNYIYIRSKSMNSFREEKGKLWVACSECERGGNGNDKDKCSCGWKVKRFNGSGCFDGTIIEKYKGLI
jgi:hypothetical protein